MRINIFTILIALIPFLVDVRGVPSMASYPIVVLIALFSLTKFKLNKENSFAMAVLLLVCTSLFRWNQFTPRFFKDIGLMAIGISPFIFKNHFRVEAKSLNILIIIGFLFAVSSDLIYFKFSINNFINSTFGIEKGASTYTLGLFSIFWMKNKKWKWALTNVFIMFLGGKRIAMVGIIFCLVLSFYLWNKKGKAYFLWKIGLFAIVIWYMKFSYDFAHGTFNDIIFKYTGKSADAFAMGRQQLFSAAFEFISFPNLWGEGPGNLYTYLGNLFGIPHVHNDFLKIYADNGLIIGLVWLWTWLRKIRYEQIATIFFIFALFCTTNCLIYVYMLFMFCFFLESDKYMYIGKILLPENMHMKRVKDDMKIMK